MRGTQRNWLFALQHAMEISDWAWANA